MVFVIKVFVECRQLLYIGTLWPPGPRLGGDVKVIWLYGLGLQRMNKKISR